MKMRVVATVLASLLAASFSVSSVAATPPPWIDEPLTGPASSTPGSIPRFTAPADDCGEDAVDDLYVQYELIGDWTTEPTTELLTIDNERIVLDVVVGNFSGDGEMVIQVFCPRPEKGFRYTARLRVAGTGGPSGGDLGADIVPALNFPVAEVTSLSKILATGNRPCIGGRIASHRLFVLTGSGKWKTEPRYRVVLKNEVPILDVTSIGEPIFDSDLPGLQEVRGEIVCRNGANEDLRYVGDITVRDTNQPAAPNPGAPPVASNVRGAIAIEPAQVTANQRVVISNAPSSPCAGLVLPGGASGITPADQGSYQFSAVRGTNAADAFAPDAAGNWAIGITFTDDFLDGQDIRRLTVTFVCATRANNSTSIDFNYQPAAFAVVARLAAAPGAGAGPNTGNPAAPAGSNAGAPGSGSAGSPTGAVGSGIDLGGFSIPTGEGADTAGELNLPRAYLDGDTQQLIEIATGLVIGEYDLVSGQFVDPATGEVTGIVDPVTGQLIDAATGIQIGISTTPPSATDGATLLGLGDATNRDGSNGDESSSNTLVIVLAAVAGALAVAVVVLALSRRKKPTLPPPPAA